MNAREYLKHWQSIDVDRVLGCSKHQTRLKTCANFMMGNNIADIGCAFGHSTNIMKGFYPGKWVGVDFCNETIETAKKTFNDIFFKYCESIESLDKMGTFDSVVCSEVIEHVEEDVLLLEKLLKIAKHNIVITTPCVMVHDPGHLRLYTEEMISELTDGIPGVSVEKIGTFFYIKIKKGGI